METGASINALELTHKKKRRLGNRIVYYRVNIWRHNPTYIRP